jgi:hypothetical protein
MATQNNPFNDVEFVVPPPPHPNKIVFDFDSPLPDELKEANRQKVIAAMLRGKNTFTPVADSGAEENVTLSVYDFMKCILQGRNSMPVKDFKARFGERVFQTVAECKGSVHVDEKNQEVWFIMAWRESEKRKRQDMRESQREIISGENMKIFRRRLINRIRQVMGLEGAAAIVAAEQYMVKTEDREEILWTKFKLKWSKTVVTDELLDELGYTLMEEKGNNYEQREH